MAVSCETIYYRFGLPEYRESPQNNAMFRNDLQWGQWAVKSQDVSEKRLFFGGQTKRL